MIEQAEKVVNLLIKQKKQIATMESCTGGGLANMITNIPGASEVLLFSAVTYSNEYKIKMGVSKEIIEQYTVYSIETARAMANSISNFTHSDYGVGITGTLKKTDPNNIVEKNDLVYFAIYNKEKNHYIEKEIQVKRDAREENKSDVICEILNTLEQELTKE